MADIKKYFKKLLKWEGGFVNDAVDHGGATNMGVTLKTFQNMGFDNNHDGKIDIDDLKLETPEEAMQICKKLFWDRWQLDLIKSQSVAESLNEWVWGSGVWGIRIPQRIMGLVDDGIVGSKTLAAVNAQDPCVFHEKLRMAKMSFIDGIVASSIAHYKEIHHFPTQEELLKNTQLRFEKGWKNRINDFKYEP
jgi:lysozyme family protein